MLNRFAFLFASICFLCAHVSLGVSANILVSIPLSTQRASPEHPIPDSILPEKNGAPASNSTALASNSTAPARDAAVEPPQEIAPLTKASDSGDDKKTLELALKTITLSQGEGGFEIWRLKAEWANMTRENNIAIVDKPQLIYFMREDSKELHVHSNTGTIDQKGQILQFIDDVTITQEEDTLKGDLLVYSGTAKTMTLPRGGTFTGTGISGTASFLVWHLNQSTIEASNGVRILFDKQKSEEE